MSIRCALAGAVWAMACGCAAQPVFAGQDPSRPLSIEVGRPLRLVLDRRTRVSSVGQPVTATLAEAVYVYDRVVWPAGTKVLGHVASLEGVGKTVRAAAMLSGNFTPGHLVKLQFDTVVLGDSRVAIQTIVTPGTPTTNREVAGAHDDGIVGHARQQVALEARNAVAAVRGPGKVARFGHFLVASLPIHPQYLEAGTTLNAQLIEPVSLGAATRTAMAPAGAAAAPGSIISARLLTALDSRSSQRGAPVRAVLTRPVESVDGAMILPEGTMLSGKVTFVQPAKGLRRNGQLRFLFDTIDVPGREAESRLGSLYSADVSRGQHVVIDEEGGTTITNPKSRFVAPALAGAALFVPMSRTEVSDEALGALTTEANVVGHGVRGYSGLGLLGVGLAVVSRPAAIAFGAVGLGRALYVSILGKGTDVVYPLHTPMEVQLSPEAPSPH